VSEPTDIKALDEYLKRGSDVSARYRELGSDDVPPELDRRVLAAARDAVANEGARRSRSWLRWSAPVALAASFVLVVTVVLEGGLQDEKPVALPQAPAEVRQEPSVEPAVASDDKANADDERKLVDELRKQQRGVVADYNVRVQNAPQPAREFAPPPAPLVVTAPSASTVAKVEAERMKSATPAQEVVVTGARRDEQQLATSPVTVVTQEDVAAAAGQTAPEADSSRDLQEVVITGGRNRRATGRTAGPRDTMSTDSFRRETRPASDEQAERSDAKAWLEEIRELRRAGKTADADREWLRFREEFPDFPVAADDLARKKP
jgi:hypothetical protein